MDSYTPIAESFHRRIDCIASAVDALAPGLESAAALLTGALLEDRKIIVCACAEDAGLAAHIATELRGASTRGPSLPAIALSAEQLPGEDAQLWRDLRTLTRDGDVLLCIDSSSTARMARGCAIFAQQRNLIAIALSEPVEDMAGVCVALQAEDQTLRSELLLMACHSLHEQVRQQLMGE